MIRVEVKSDVIREKIQGLLPMMQDMIPRWCDLLVVMDHDQDTDDANPCCIVTNLEYNQATLHLYPSWVIDNEDSRLHYVKHEMFHMVLAPVTDWSRDLLKQIISEGQFRDFVLQDHRIRVENVIQELARKYERNESGLGQTKLSAAALQQHSPAILGSGNLDKSREAGGNGLS